jgi:hypothetical protein
VQTNTLTLVTALKTTSDITQFLANLITILLGLFAFYALIFHGRKIGILFRVMVSAFLNERVKRIKETLGKLEAFNFNIREDRPEIVALLGQLSGQIKPLTSDSDAIASLHAEIIRLLDKPTTLNEATKRRIISVSCAMRLTLKTKSKPSRVNLPGFWAAETLLLLPVGVER